MSSSSTTERPWLDEPDEHHWVWKGQLKCQMYRNSSGAWCGYVIVPSAHPDYDRNYEDWDICTHGGLTFSGMLESPPGSRKSFAVGFDCAHVGDLLPRAVWRCGRHAEYRTFQWVKDETEKLAEQVWDGLTPLAQLAVASTMEDMNNG